MEIESLLQLSKASKAVQPLDRDNYDNYKTEKVYYSAKEKIAELLLCRAKGEDIPFKWVLGDEKCVMFSSRIDYAEGFVQGGAWAQLSDPDKVDFILPDEGLMRPSYLFDVLLELTHVDCNSLRCIIKCEEGMDREEYKKLLKNRVGSVIETASRHECPDEEDFEEDEASDGLDDDLAEFLIACNDAADGFFDAAMRNELFESMVEGLCSWLQDFYPYEYIIRNPWLFLAPVLMSTPDNWYYVDYIRSKEIYAYHQYKHMVPEEEREYIDCLLDIFDNPFPEKMSCDAADFDSLAEHVVTVMYAESDGGWQDVNLFWKESMDYLSKALPEMREKYASTVIQEVA